MDEYGFRLSSRCEVSYEGTSFLEAERRFYRPDGTLLSYDKLIYNEKEQIAQRWRYDGEDDSVRRHFEYYYDEQGKEIRYDAFDENGEMYAYFIKEYDETGRLVSETRYSPDGEMRSYKIYE